MLQNKYIQKSLSNDVDNYNKQKNKIAFYRFIILNINL